MSNFGLAFPKPKGMMIICEEHIEDDLPLPKLPNKYICDGVLLAGKKLSRAEYTKEYIKTQRWF